MQISLKDIIVRIVLFVPSYFKGQHPQTRLRLKHWKLLKMLAIIEGGWQNVTRDNRKYF